MNEIKKKTEEKNEKNEKKLKNKMKKKPEKIFVFIQSERQVRGT